MSKVVANSVVLGQSGTDTNNFLLDTDAAGALRIRRKSDGSGGSVLTVNSAGTLVQPAQSMVRLNTGNGNGSTNTVIRRFANLVTNQGVDITYADSATAGASFTINTAGVYTISYTDGFSTQVHFGLSLNSSQLTTAIVNITAADRLISAFTSAANNESCVAWTGYLPAGSVIRPHGDGGANAAVPAMTQFTLVRVA